MNQIQRKTWLNNRVKNVKIEKIWIQIYFVAMVVVFMAIQNGNGFVLNVGENMNANWEGKIRYIICDKCSFFCWRDKNLRIRMGKMGQKRTESLYWEKRLSCFRIYFNKANFSQIIFVMNQKNGSNGKKSLPSTAKYPSKNVLRDWKNHPN